MQKPNGSRGGKALRALPSDRETRERAEEAGTGIDVSPLWAEGTKLKHWSFTLQDCHPKNPLNQGHGRTKAGLLWRSHERKQLRQRTLLAGLAAVPPPERRRVDHLIDVLIVRVYRVHKMDGDGWQAAAKPIRDGVADIFNKDDGNPCFRWIYLQRKGPPGTNAVCISIFATPHGERVFKELT